VQRVRQVAPGLRVASDQLGDLLGQVGLDRFTGGRAAVLLGDRPPRSIAGRLTMAREQARQLRPDVDGRAPAARTRSSTASSRASSALSSSTSHSRQAKLSGSSACRGRETLTRDRVVGQLGQRPALAVQQPVHDPSGPDRRHRGQLRSPRA
jgi:hypothetical protein